MSTSLLERAMKNYIASIGTNDTVEAHGAEVAKGKISEFDIVLLGPQVRFMKKGFDEIAGGKPVEIIAPADYAMAKGENVYKTAKALLEKK